MRFAQRPNADLLASRGALRPNDFRQIRAFRKIFLYKRHGAMITRISLAPLMENSMPGDPPLSPGRRLREAWSRGPIAISFWRKNWTVTRTAFKNVRAHPTGYDLFYDVWKDA